MRRLSHTLTALFLLGATLGCTLPAIAQQQPVDVKPGPDSQQQPNVPHGKTMNFTWKTSRIYPGTDHNVTVYVPAQYDGSKAACVMCFQDGLGFSAPNVFDNLIARKEMPVTIGIGVTPGVSPATLPDALPRFNRSIEYDTPDDTYARFLIEEILPAVSKNYSLKLSSDPNDRGLAGGSSGGIAAFIAAWERPDQFRRVFSCIGSFTDLCGGDTYPSKIRKYEQRPLRVFLQDNDHDQDIYSGSWPLANMEIAAALAFNNYDHRYAVNFGGHDGRPGGAQMPEVMRYLWHDYPAPIKAATTSRAPVMQFLIPGEDWQPVGTATAQRLASDGAGNVYFSDASGFHVLRVDASGNPVPFYTSKSPVHALVATPDSHLIVATDTAIVSVDSAGKDTVVGKGISASSLTVNGQGVIYGTDRHDGTVWLLDKTGKRHKVGGEAGKDGNNEKKEKKEKASPDAMHSAPVTPLAYLALTPDQSLMVSTGGGPRKALLLWRVQPDGNLTDAEPFFDLQIPYNQMGTQASAFTNDSRGWLYVATPAGVQICDQAGRVNGILALPDRATTDGIAWGGAAHDTLFLSCGGKLYRRKLKVKGILPCDAPVTPPGPRL